MLNREGSLARPLGGLDVFFNVDFIDPTEVELGPSQGGRASYCRFRWQACSKK